MSNKYIVKNCPCVSTSSENEPLCYECLNNNPREPWRCMDRDCLIKQVIEMCREHVDSLCPCPDEGKSCIECTIAEEEYIACQLMQLFDIEECTDEN